MGAKSILLAVADSQALAEINQALGPGWESVSAISEAEALAELEKRSFAVLLVDFNLGAPDSSLLLNQVLEKHPETLRFLVAYEADLALVAAKVDGAHQILPKPIEAASVKSRIESALNELDSGQSESEPAADEKASPTIPSVYSQVLKALETPGVTNEQVAEIIESDGALTIEVLRLTRSTYMGLPRDLTDPVDAVEALGLETVRALVTALRFLAEHSHLKPGYLSIGQLWQHSTNVAQIARDLVLFETKDRALASQAFIAGLLHDLGKVVLVTNFGDLYGRVHSLARKQPVPLWDIEKEMFGANHGEIGACLVGMWNMPAAVVEATASHHEPPHDESDKLTPLAAVHIANVLEHQLRPSDEFRVAPIIDAAFLNELGLLQRLPVWRAMFANRNGGSQQPPVDSTNPEPLDLETTPSTTDTAASSRTATYLQAPPAAPRTSTSGYPDETSKDRVTPFEINQTRWVYVGVAAVVLFLLTLWLWTRPETDDSAPVYARTPTVIKAPEAASSAPLEQPASIATPPDPLPAAAPTVEPATNSATAPVASLAEADPEPAPEPEPIVVPALSATNTPAPSSTPQESPLPEFRLKGIIYGVARPSAILNGKTVYVGDQVNGATVVQIRQTDLTLEIHGLRKTYTLP